MFRTWLFVEANAGQDVNVFCFDMFLFQCCGAASQIYFEFASL